MKAPAVSVAHGYRQLCLAARNEEKRLAELGKQRQYCRPTMMPVNQQSRPVEPSGTSDTQEGSKPTSGALSSGDSRRCFKCGQPGHLARNCRAKRSESQGSKVTRPPEVSSKTDTNRQLNLTSIEKPSCGWNPRILECLYSDQEDCTGEVQQVRVTYNGSRRQYAPVQLQGVPTCDVIDSGPDITIVGG